MTDFEVIVLRRELIYMNTFVGLGFVSETPEQTAEQVWKVRENVAQVDVCYFRWLQRNDWYEMSEVC